MLVASSISDRIVCALISRRFFWSGPTNLSGIPNPNSLLLGGVTSFYFSTFYFCQYVCYFTSPTDIARDPSFPMTFQCEESVSPAPRSQIKTPFTFLTFPLLVTFFTYGQVRVGQCNYMREMGVGKSSGVACRTLFATALEPLVGKSSRNGSRTLP